MTVQSEKDETQAAIDLLVGRLERIRRDLQQQEAAFYRRFFVAMAGGEMLGVGGVKAADWASDTHILHLSAVAPEQRGKGIGRALIAARVAWVEANFERKVVKRFALYNFRTGIGQEAFTLVFVSTKQNIGYDGVENCVSQKFETLIAQ